MPTIQVKHNRKTYEFLQKTQKRHNILYGSAGAGKSWSMAQFLLLEKLYKERDIRILVTMKTRPALKKAAWLLINDLLLKYEMPGYDLNRSDLTVTVGNNQMFFVPLDDPAKLKSFERINYIWAEEASTLTKQDYLQLGLRCRGHNPNGHNQLFFTFNPVDEQSFLKEITDNPGPKTAVNHSTYKDNGFLDQDYIEEIEALEQQDKTYWKIYGLGIWATPENIIFTKWDVVVAFPEDCKEIKYGLDFGYNKPSALLKVGLKGEEDAYLQELLYQTKLTNQDLIEKLKEKIAPEHRQRVMRADSAEPARIQEIYDAGFNVHPCTKGKDSVKMSIDRMKRYNLHWTEDSVNGISEIRGYKWKEDKEGKPTDEPVDFRNHLIDGGRYSLGEVPEVQEEMIILGSYQV